MNAYVDHQFKNGFNLDEVRVRKLHELISSRLAKLHNSPTLTLKVYRGDSSMYETLSVEDVLKEDNDDWRAIVALDFTAETENVLSFLLRFSHRGASIKIVGDDRDAVFLIFSDIREYLQSSVLSGTIISRDTIRLIPLLLMIFAMFGFIWSLFSSIKSDPAIVAKAISNNNIVEKLNYLINEQSKREFPSHALTWLLFVMLSMICSINSIFESGWRILFPLNLFLFGQRKEAHDRRRALLSKIFWVVIVGLAVSILAGFVLTWKGVN